MKVIKFGGTSVGSVDSILSVKKIIEGQSEPVIVVVSALGGITDKLLKTSQMAVMGDASYQQSFEEIKARHEEMIGAIIPAGEKRDKLVNTVGELLEELRSIFQGVYLIRDLSPKIQAAIVSYGERISSQIVAALIEGAEWFDSREFIKTEFKAGKNRLVRELTNKLVRKTFGEVKSEELRVKNNSDSDSSSFVLRSSLKCVVVGGFISTDIESGEVTNLGRGGSDYTASIIAAALEASVLEIWTDVDGFMTADPKVISSAYVIPELTYIEAMELSNFGAKVIYPPTIYPVCIKHIPILIKNTFNPDAPGSIIKDDVKDDSRSIKGISSIKGTTLITVSGLSMVGVIGVNRRIFTCLADNGISVFMVSQASSENSTSIGVQDEDADEACRVLDLEFQKEIEDGAMFPMLAEKGFQFRGGGGSGSVVADIDMQIPIGLRVQRIQKFPKPVERGIVNGEQNGNRFCFHDGLPLSKFLRYHSNIFPRRFQYVIQISRAFFAIFNGNPTKDKQPSDKKRAKSQKLTKGY